MVVFWRERGAVSSTGGERQEAEQGVQPGTGQAAVLGGNGLDCVQC
jgi:hypothetical protein